MKRFLIIFLSLITAISLTVLFFTVKFRIERHGWVITTAEITFIGLPDGSVFGTFTDYNGKVHSEHSMYTDGRFQPYFNPTAIDSEPYLGSTVRIMYDPTTITSEEKTNTTTNGDVETVVGYRGIDIESYDNWLQRFIISGIAFFVSCTSTVVFCAKTLRKKRAKGSEKQI